MKEDSEHLCCGRIAGINMTYLWKARSTGLLVALALLALPKQCRSASTLVPPPAICPDSGFPNQASLITSSLIADYMSPLVCFTADRSDFVCCTAECGPVTDNQATCLDEQTGATATSTSNPPPPPPNLPANPPPIPTPTPSLTTTPTPTPTPTATSTPTPNPIASVPNGELVPSLGTPAPATISSAPEGSPDALAPTSPPAQALAPTAQLVTATAPSPSSSTSTASSPSPASGPGNPPPNQSANPPASVNPGPSTTRLLDMFQNPSDTFRNLQPRVHSSCVGFLGNCSSLSLAPIGGTHRVRFTFPNFAAPLISAHIAAFAVSPLLISPAKRTPPRRSIFKPSRHRHPPTTLPGIHPPAWKPHCVAPPRYDSEGLHDGYLGNPPTASLTTSPPNSHPPPQGVAPPPPKVSAPPPPVVKAPPPPRVPTNRTFTVRNNCAQTVWVAQFSVPGYTPLTTTSNLTLTTGQTAVFTTDNTWIGRIWGRTRCGGSPFRCATGDCNGATCAKGVTGQPPATLAEFTLAQPRGLDFYDVSVVDGFNLQIQIKPSKSSCPTIGCVADLVNNGACPAVLQKKDASGKVVGCYSACSAPAMTTSPDRPKYCCTGNYSLPGPCQAVHPDQFSSVLKTACPTAYSYAYDENNNSLSQCPGGSGDYDIFMCWGA
ncbi:Pathogenesis-related thaumatin superfamily protein [Klebsormidium nitens]|uniref:Pathogenesis-related thaumatin superfamily protein n=1 Tax=Klebsormidium nitens TaxID=105231 RepID=A0A1Y1ICU8_KLENI|nr:Pathogenesis-related thaumatin superfamily protein [Klebsormidium nitens]|eukprot:GAQ87772.1 Pathogenesis-related thaumatin superfamily protein [Klebsormidium nitens]